MYLEQKKSSKETISANGKLSMVGTGMLYQKLILIDSNPIDRKNPAKNESVALPIRPT
jgi:hypothetical protein